MKPLLTLAMIVKDEAKSIARTLSSILGVVDSWIILDTGSTDGTPEIIRETMRNLPGEVRFAPFVDFATTRNLALEMAAPRAIFSLMLSGDESLVDPQMTLRPELESRVARCAPEDGAYNLRVGFASHVYDSARIYRAGSGWSYQGVTHEVLCSPQNTGASERIEGAMVYHDVSNRDLEKSRKRWQLDTELLGRELIRNPADARTCFYLAQSHECLGELDRAEILYRRRIVMGGFPEEVYESLFRLARVQLAMGSPWYRVQEAYLRAHAHSPERAEPLYEIAHHYQEEKSWALCYLFALRAAQIPFPVQCRSFVDPELYRSRAFDILGTAAFYLKEYRVGRHAILAALRHHPKDPRLLANLALFPDSQ